MNKKFLMIALGGIGCLAAGITSAATVPMPAQPVPTASTNNWYVGAFAGAVEMPTRGSTVTYKTAEGGAAIPYQQGRAARFSVVSGPGYNGGLSLGYRFLNTFRAEVAASYLNANVDQLRYVNKKVPHSGGYTDMWTGFFNLYYDANIISKTITPYVGLGIGDVYLHTVARANANISAASVKGKRSALAGQGIAGIMWNFGQNKHWGLGLDYRYLMTTKVKTIFAQTPNAFRGLFKTYYRVQMLNLNLAYRFC